MIAVYVGRCNLFLQHVTLDINSSVIVRLHVATSGILLGITIRLGALRLPKLPWSVLQGTYLPVGARR
jgi:hypothetical protein